MFADYQGMRSYKVGDMGVIHFIVLISRSMYRRCAPKDNLITLKYSALPEFIRKLCRWVETEITAGIITCGRHDGAGLLPHSCRVDPELKLPSVQNFTWSLCVHPGFHWFPYTSGCFPESPLAFSRLASLGRLQQDKAITENE